MSEKQTTLDWLNNLYQESSRDRMQRIFWEIDHWLVDKYYGVVDAILANVDLERLSLSEAVGIASITLAADKNSHVHNYAAYYQRLWEHIGRIEPLRREAILRGLEPKKQEAP